MPNVSPIYELQEKIASLEEALLSALPTMPSLLRDIHRSLKADPENVTLLTEEEISLIVKGLEKQTSTSISTAALKAPSRKALSKLSIDDL